MFPCSVITSSCTCTNEGYFFIHESMDGSEASEALFLSEEDPPNEIELGEEYGENNRGRCVLQKVVA